MNRRDVLKVAAAATGAAAVTGAISYGDAAASPLTGRRRLRYAKPQAAEEQIFYHTGIYTDPTSFDWNPTCTATPRKRPSRAFCSSTRISRPSPTGPRRSSRTRTRRSGRSTSARTTRAGRTERRSLPATSSIPGAANLIRRPRPHTPASSSTSSTPSSSTPVPLSTTRTIH